MAGFDSRELVCAGIRTHYLEAGEGPDLVLLHSGEFGGCAQFSWERNIPVLARHFRVLAPDFVGYGRSEKLFSYEDMWGFRIRHIAAFLEAKNVQRAHFVGNSLGATMLLSVAAMEQPSWPLDRIVAAAGGGVPPESDARQILTGYDGTPEAMRRALGVLCNDPAIADDPAYIARRQEEALRPGAWECAASSRFRAPWRTASSMVPNAPLDRIRAPTLIIAGAADRVRGPDFGQDLQAEVPGSSLCVIPHAGHCPQIDRPREFEAAVIPFLLSKA